MSWWNPWISLPELAHWIQYFTPWTSLAAISPGRLPTDIFTYLREEKQCFNSSLVQVCTWPQRSFPAEDRFPQRRIAIWAPLHIKTNRRFQACFPLLYSQFNTGGFCWKDIYSCLRRCWAPLNRAVGTLMPQRERQGESTSRGWERARGAMLCK